VAPLQSVVRDQPDSFQARYLLGLCQLFIERYRDAVASLEPLWPRTSGNFMYLYVLGIAAHNAEMKELDEKAMNQLIQVGEDSPEFHMIVGKAFLNREEPRKAIDELQKAEGAAPSLPFLHFGLGTAYLQLQDNEKAEAEFKKEIAIEPDLPDIYEQLGELYLKQERFEDAEKEFREALRRNPKMPASLFGLARIHQQQEKYAQALSEIDQAARLAPKSKNVHFVRGRILMKLGRREEAQKEMDLAQKIIDVSFEKDREATALKNGVVRNPELTQAPQ
jgi:tetratricopeptide (TPR) repeat protein